MGVNDKAALVTGASSGIGSDLARELAARGYDLVLLARRADRLQALAGEIAARHGVRCHVLAADLADRAQVDTVVERAQQALGDVPLTVLANNAGSGVWDLFADVPREIAQRDIDLNVTALATLTHDFVTRAKAHGRPAYVLNIASLAGMLPAARFAVYSATKSFVLTFSEVLAWELRDSHVRVTCVCPGGVKTEFLEHAGQELKKDVGMMDSPEVARQSVEAMLRGDVVFVPGALNKVSALARFLPRALRLRLVERSMQMAVRPAK